MLDKILVALKTPVIVIMVMVLISLVTTVILYSFFENIAIFENAAEGIKLGGSVAFFFILFTTINLIYKNMYYDKLLPIREAISGEWICESEVINYETNQTQTYISNATIKIGQEGKITLIGNIEGMHETWEADEVVLTDSKLVYFFDVPMLQMTGVTNLRFAYKNESKLTAMQGYWILAGQEGKGNVTFTRKPEE